MATNRRTPTADQMKLVRDNPENLSSAQLADELGVTTHYIDAWKKSLALHQKSLALHQKSLGAARERRKFPKDPRSGIFNVMAHEDWLT